MKIKKVITFVVAQFIRVWVTAFAGIAVYVPLSALRSPCCEIVR